MDEQRKRTVRVEPVAGYPALWLIWAHEIDRRDVHPAFDELQQRLNKAREPLYVLVDLRENPKFPLNETLMSALSGPFRHPLLAEWLVIGSSIMGRAIGRTLSAVAMRKNILWFETEEEAFAYMNEAHARQIDPA